MKKGLNHEKNIPWIPRPLPFECLFLLNIYLGRTNPKWFDDRGHASVIFKSYVKIHFKPSSPLIFHLISGALLQHNYLARAQNVNRTSSQIGDPNMLISICLSSYSVLIQFWKLSHDFHKKILFLLMCNINLALNIKQNQTSVLRIWLFVPSWYNYSCMTAAPAGYSPCLLYLALKAYPALRDEFTALELPVRIHLKRFTAATQSHFYHYLGFFVWFWIWFLFGFQLHFANQTAQRSICVSQNQRCLKSSLV